MATSRPTEAVAGAVATGVRVLSGLRGGRLFAPTGRAFEGELKFWPGRAPSGVELFQEAGPHRVLARLSRGMGVPEPLPDVLGLAVKVTDAYGPGRDQDFLFASCFPGPLGHLTLFPTTGWLGKPFSSILPYDAGGRTLVLGAIPRTQVALEGSGREEVEEAVREGVLQFGFAVSPRIGRWREIGVLYLEERAEGIDLAFDPWNTGRDLRPAGFLNTLRTPAYEGGRLGRKEAQTEYR